MKSLWGVGVRQGIPAGERSVQTCFAGRAVGSFRNFPPLRTTAVASRVGVQILGDRRQTAVHLAHRLGIWPRFARGLPKFLQAAATQRFSTAIAPGSFRRAGSGDTAHQTGDGSGAWRAAKEIIARSPGSDREICRDRSTWERRRETRPTDRLARRGSPARPANSVAAPRPRPRARRLRRGASSARSAASGTRRARSGRARATPRSAP